MRDDPPPGWGLTSLTDAFDQARKNQFATHDRKKGATRDLALIDRILFELLEGRIDPNPMFPMQFFLRAHSCYRATAACAMAGQAYEATVLQRAVLEAAAYGLYIGADNDRAAMWLNRGDSNSAKERVRTAFGFGSLKRDMLARHPDLEPLFVELYDAFVDFGAHPNEAGFAISANVRKVNGGKVFDTVYLHDDEGPALEFALKNTARVGLWIVLCFRKLYPIEYGQADLDELVDEMVARH